MRVFNYVVYQYQNDTFMFLSVKMASCPTRPIQHKGLSVSEYLESNMETQ